MISTKNIFLFLALGILQASCVQQVTIPTKLCPRQVEQFQNGEIDGPDKDFYEAGERLWYLCNEKYVLKGEQDVTCLSNGKWTSPPPTCTLEIRPCQPRNGPENGNQKPLKKTYYVGDVVTYSCDSNFKLVGKSISLCLPNSLWSYPVPTCEALRKGYWTRFFDRDDPSYTGDYEDLRNIRKEYKNDVCATPIDIDARLLNGEDYRTANQIVTISPTRGFICINKHQKKGDCLDYKVRFFCPLEVVQNCRRPDEPNNGDIIPLRVNEFKPGQKIWFKCNSPYILVGTKDFRCQDDGTWHSDQFPSCVACRKPRTPQNGNLRPHQDLYRVNQRVDFSCASGFKLVGAGWIKCLETGRWSNAEPKCVPVVQNCRRPDEPNNGDIIPPRVNEFKPGQKIWFKCNSPYTLVGTKDFRCQDDGTWHPEQFPSCVDNQPQHKTVIACENKLNVYVRCPPHHKIQVVRGFYGRDARHVCPSTYIRTTSCSARGSEEKLRKLCHNRNYCRLYPTNRVFGDPCRGTYKYIKLTYYCEKH